MMLAINTISEEFYISVDYVVVLVYLKQRIEEFVFSVCQEIQHQESKLYLLKTSVELYVDITFTTIMLQAYISVLRYCQDTKHIKLNMFINGNFVHLFRSVISFIYSFFAYIIPKYIYLIRYFPLY